MGCRPWGRLTMRNWLPNNLYWCCPSLRVQWLSGWTEKKSQITDWTWCEKQVCNIRAQCKAVALGDKTSFPIRTKSKFTWVAYRGCIFKTQTTDVNIDSHHFQSRNNVHEHGSLQAPSYWIMKRKRHVSNNDNAFNPIMTFDSGSSPTAVLLYFLAAIRGNIPVWK